MNWIDALLILVFGISIWMGYHRGFILGSLNLLVWLGSFVTAYSLYDETRKILEKLFELNIWLLPLSFIVTLLLARLVLGLIKRLIVRSVSDKSNHSSMNKYLGVFPGVINGWIASIIISALLLSLPLRESINAETRESHWATTLAMQSEWANKKLAPVFDQAVRHTMNSLTVHPGTSEKVSLGFTYDNAHIRPYLEMKMLLMVNEERKKHGLKPLAPDPELTLVARAHSGDMFAKGYFAHESLDGSTPFDRMRKANIRFSTAGENLALAQTLDIAHTNLMNSPGHRANILHPSFGRVGIGILDGGFFGLMISQEFRD